MNNKFMQRAIELAHHGMTRGDGGPFGAVIVKDSEIVGEGWNRVIATHDPTAHGEVVAIRDACEKSSEFSLLGCEIYTTGQPCPMCLGAIYWARISKIFYGFSIQDAEQIGFDDQNFFQQLALPAQQRLIPETQIDRDRAILLAEEYQKLPIRHLY
jgi:guanine deaminase